MTAPQIPRTLPRRANTIRAVAATMAHRKMTEVGQRQAVSDKIGYAVAVALGGAAFRYGGRWAVVALAACYLVNAWLAYRKWKRLNA